MTTATDPSEWRSGSLASVTSATTWPGTVSSSSSSPFTKLHRISSAPGEGIRSEILCCSPIKVNDCQSVERNAVSRILSRFTLARLRSERRSPAAAGDIGSRIIGSPPDRRQPAEPFEAAVLFPYEGRRRSVDPQGRRGQIESVPPGRCARIFRFPKADTLDIPLV